MSQIQEVKEASDIVSVIGGKVSLQRAGKYFKGCCPFHSERSPSFFVDPVLQRYKCFGCGESGDVLTFLEKFDGLSFAEALQELAQSAGIVLEKITKSSDDSKREQLLEILSLACQYYHYLLTKHTLGEPAREYLQNRKVTAQSIKLFQMGYALDQWEGLLTFLHKKKKYSIQMIEEAGLIVQGKNGKYYDRFRSRIIFPLKDHRGRIVGFSGRKIGADAKDAKYINSPETLLYHKSKLLFGFSELYQEIRKAGFVVVVEGEFDVVSSTQAHMNSVVAIKGSALTQDHAKLLERSVEKVLLALDTDSAGVAATKKAITALKNTQLELRVILIPDGKDPDELIKTDPKSWKTAVKESVSAHEFLILVAFKQFDPATPEGKNAIMKELLPVLSELEHAVELEHYSRQVAEKLGVKLESVKTDIAQYKSKHKLGAIAAVAKAAVSAPQKQGITTTPEVISKEKGARSSADQARKRLECYVLFLLLQSTPTDIFERLRALLSHNITFTTPGITQIIAYMQSYSGMFDLKKYAQGLPSDLQELLFEIHSNQEFVSSTQNDAQNTTQEFDLNSEWRSSVAKLKKMHIAVQKQQLIEEISVLDEKLELTPEEQEEHDRLLRALADLNIAERVL